MAQKFIYLQQLLQKKGMYEIKRKCLNGFRFWCHLIVKLSFQCGGYSYGSVAGALRSVCRTEGPAALFSGLMATLLRDVPFSGIDLRHVLQPGKSVTAQRWVEDEGNVVLNK